LWLQMLTAFDARMQRFLADQFLNLCKFKNREIN
jgi:hypothetical protein